MDHGVHAVLSGCGEIHGDRPITSGQVHIANREWGVGLGGWNVDACPQEAVVSDQSDEGACNAHGEVSESTFHGCYVLSGGTGQRLCLLQRNNALTGRK